MDARLTSVSARRSGFVSRAKVSRIFTLAHVLRSVKLDATAFQDCLDTGRHTARVKEDMDGGRAAGITGTPGNILLHNGTGEAKLEAGAQRLSTLKKSVDEMLASSKE